MSRSSAWRVRCSRSAAAVAGSRASHRLPERLWLGDVDLVADGHARLGDLDLSSPEVDVSPAQPGHLTATHPGRGEQHPRGEQPVGAYMGKERAELLRAPDLHLWGADLRQVHRVSDVADDISPAHGDSERRVQGGVDVLHGLGREAALAVAAATGEQVSVEGGELPGGECLEVPAAERRHDVILALVRCRRFPVVGSGPISTTKVDDIGIGAPTLS
jgi:hypothetical protein